VSRPTAYYQDRTGPADALTGDDARGVQVIAQDHPQVGRELVTGGDYYIRRDDGLWYAVDINGLFDWLLDCPDVAFGRMIRGDEYGRIMAEAQRDKQGYTARERKA